MLVADFLYFVCDGCPPYHAFTLIKFSPWGLLGKEVAKWHPFTTTNNSCTPTSSLETPLFPCGTKKIQKKKKTRDPPSFSYWLLFLCYTTIATVIKGLPTCSKRERKISDGKLLFSTVFHQSLYWPVLHTYCMNCALQVWEKTGKLRHLGEKPLSSRKMLRNFKLYCLYDSAQVIRSWWWEALLLCNFKVVDKKQKAFT